MLVHLLVQSLRPPMRNSSHEVLLLARAGQGCLHEEPRLRVVVELQPVQIIGVVCRVWWHSVLPTGRALGDVWNEGGGLGQYAIAIFGYRRHRSRRECHVLRRG